MTDDTNTTSDGMPATASQVPAQPPAPTAKPAQSPARAAEAPHAARPAPAPVPHAEQPALKGLAPRKRRKRASAATKRTPAARNPIARVVLDLKAPHLGQPFDYLVDEDLDEDALPGVRVRVRFGGRLTDGIIWERAAKPDNPSATLRYLERVVTPMVLIDEQMRRDITLIADRFGGTRAQIANLAIPPRVARIDREQQAALNRAAAGMGGSGDTRRSVGDDMLERARAEEAAHYGADPIGRIRDAMDSAGLTRVVWDALPGQNRWPLDIAWLVVEALAHGLPAVVVTPTERHARRVFGVLQAAGLKPFAPKGTSGAWDGDMTLIAAAQPPEVRYRNYLSVATGRVRCVIGPRTAMYAPVQGPALFVAMDEDVYQNADGMAPYANVAGVLDVRAQAHGGVLAIVAQARSPRAQRMVERGGSRVVEVHGLDAVREHVSPRIEWLSREKLAVMGDPLPRARVPMTVFDAIDKVLADGPVLLSVPEEGMVNAYACAGCHRQARCARCTGPLISRGGPVPVCRWCGAAAAGWTCPHCGADTPRAVSVGAQGTALELSRQFTGTRFVVSTPRQPRGIVETVPDERLLVIATPGAEPRVAGAGYRAAAILDAHASQFRPGLDARVDTLLDWMAVAGAVVPARLGGRVMLVGDCDPVVAESLVAWDSRVLAAEELDERSEAALPPAVAAANVWGSRDAVMRTLGDIHALDGDFALIGTAEGEMPSVLGPIEIPPDPVAARGARQLEEVNDRVRAIVRVPANQGDELARRLRIAIARHWTAREPGELRFRIDPKDLY